MRKGANKDSKTSACLPFRAEMSHLSRQYFWNLARFRMLWCCTELYWKVFLIFYLHHLIFIYIIYIQYMEEQKYSEWLACNTTNYVLKNNYVVESTFLYYSVYKILKKSFTEVFVEDCIIKYVGFYFSSQLGSLPGQRRLVVIELLWLIWDFF